jgi:MoaA/NifB/PqqE/SkfB family radical SAM enzyme
MSFADVVRRTWRENHLFSALVELTYRCNWDCFFCYNDLGLRGRPLDREQYFRLFEDLRELGTLNLILSGGEPLAHPDFFTLGAKGRELGFLIRVKSNGHALRGAVARRLREEVDPWIVEVSLHGATPATHDRQTRVPGSFERLLENLRGLQDLGVRLQINSTLTAWNEGELEGMLQLARDLGVPLQVDPEVSARDNGDAEPLSIRPSREAVLRLFRLQTEARRAALGAGGETPADLAVGREGDALLPAAAAGEKHCGAGAATIAVDPYGTVYPCVQWRRPVGNLHERSLREIWTSSAELAAVREDNVRVRTMIEGLGPTAGLMGFCPGNAAAATGDPTGIYPAAATKLALRREVVAEPERAVLPILR